MSTTDIREAAFEKLKTFSYSPQPEIMWPGIQEDPPEEGMWLQAIFSPNKPENIAWGNDSCVDTRGFFRVLVYYRPGQSEIDPSELADALIAFYPKGLDLGPVRVLQRPWQDSSVTQDASKLYIPVTIEYKGLT